MQAFIRAFALLQTFESLLIFIPAQISHQEIHLHHVYQIQISYQIFVHKYRFLESLIHMYPSPERRLTALPVSASNNDLQLFRSDAFILFRLGSNQTREIPLDCF